MYRQRVLNKEQHHYAKCKHLKVPLSFRLLRNLKSDYLRRFTRLCAGRDANKENNRPLHIRKHSQDPPPPPPPHFQTRIHHPRKNSIRGTQYRPLTSKDTTEGQEKATN